MASIPPSLLSCEPGQPFARPRYLGPHDEPWLRALLAEYARFEGRPHRELVDHLRVGLSAPAPRGKLTLARTVLDDLCVERLRPAVPPATLRAALFGQAARADGTSRSKLLASAAADLHIEPEDVDRFLLCDLPPERPMATPPGELTPLELALRTNLALARALVRRSTRVDIDVLGNARPIVRLARLRGLICNVAPDATLAGARDHASTTTSSLDEEPHLRCRISLSGPLALFRRTIVYGRALAALVPALAWCDDFRFLARCELDDGPLTVALGTGDPIFPTAAPPRHDSRLEERFERDFTRLTDDWDVVREPRPVPAGDALVFPDFALVHRRDRRRRWLLEIVGFWTAEYLERKLAHLRQAAIDRLIVCVDGRRNCGADEMPHHARILPYRRRVDARAVLRLVEGAAADGADGSRCHQRPEREAWPT